MCDLLFVAEELRVIITKYIIILPGRAQLSSFMLCSSLLCHSDEEAL